MESGKMENITSEVFALSEIIATKIAKMSMRKIKIPGTLVTKDLLCFLKKNAIVLQIPITQINSSGMI